MIEDVAPCVWPASAAVSSSGMEMYIYKDRRGARPAGQAEEFGRWEREETAMATPRSKCEAHARTLSALPWWELTRMPRRIEKNQ
jgi:hypothetical protein